jgi:hypothetical protein
LEGGRVGPGVGLHEETKRIKIFLLRESNPDYPVVLSVEQALCRLNSYFVVMTLQTNAVMPNFPFADMIQPYQLQVHNVFVIGGNVAVLRCTIPSFVRGLVQVTNWLKDEHLLGRIVIHPGDRYVLSVGRRLSLQEFHSLRTGGETHAN